MKVRRQKALRRSLLFYKHHYGLAPPYHVLVDGTFCKAALKFKVNISEQLPKYLEADVRVLTTRCVLAECEYFGEMLYGPLKVLRQFPVRPCGHTTPQPPVKCLRRMLTGNKCAEKFLIATQDPLLSAKLRRMPGAPLLYISHNAITLEPPSPASQAQASTSPSPSLVPRDHQTLALLKQQLLGQQGAGEQIKKKRRHKIKGPNPLSCKKKKNNAECVAAVTVSGSGEGRRRRKGRQRKGGAMPPTVGAAASSLTTA